MQFENFHVDNYSPCVSIPQAVWIACNFDCFRGWLVHLLFQYRKRYGLHAISDNTNGGVEVSLFQYRKRYGLHAIAGAVFVGVLF